MQRCFNTAHLTGTSAPERPNMISYEGINLHPQYERDCDKLLEHPLLKTPPPEPEKPRTPWVRRPRQFKIPERFNLLDIEFYKKWVNHFKEVQMTTHKVDDSPPELFPELYLKPRRLDFYARQLEENMKVNKELLKKINLIQRSGGYVDCWLTTHTNKYNKLLCEQRQRLLDEIRHQNLYFYNRLLRARSKQPLTKELNEMWKDTKRKLIVGSTQAFILFKTDRIDRNMTDPAMEKPPNVVRPRVILDIRVRGGSKIGKVTIELFSDIVPAACNLFLHLIKGDSRGYAYRCTRFFRIVPNLYCCGGDVCKDNGFGCYIKDGDKEPQLADNNYLNHTIPGVLSMTVTKDNEMCGIFNIIFKPLPQFNGKNVVFGRIISGPAQTLERISALGHPRGTTSADVIIYNCKYMNKMGHFRDGNGNTIKFPPRRNLVRKSAK